MGRTSQARAIHPEISLDFDDAVSSRHAILTLAADGSLVLRDTALSSYMEYTNIVERLT